MNSLSGHHQQVLYILIAYNLFYSQMWYGKMKAYHLFIYLITVLLLFIIFCDIFSDIWCQLVEMEQFAFGNGT